MRKCKGKLISFYFLNIKKERWHTTVYTSKQLCDNYSILLIILGKNNIKEQLKTLLSTHIFSY